MRHLLLLLFLISSLSCRKFIWDNPNDTLNPSSEPASLKDGLVAYYPFNGNANDESINSIDGIISNLSFISDRFGLPNSAINFSSDSFGFVRTPNVITDIVNTFTISCWVKPLSSDMLITEGTISTEIPQYRQQRPSGAGNMMVLHPTHGSAWGDFSLNAGVGFSVGKNQIAVTEHSNQYVASSLVYQSNFTKWHFITIVYKNHLPHLYVDGVLVKIGQITNVQNVRPSNGNCVLGFGGYSTSGFGRAFSSLSTLKPDPAYHGFLDEFRIYNRALTQEEITYLAYN